MTAANARAKFEKIDEDAVKPKPTAKQVVTKAKFDNKIAKFEGMASAASTGPASSARGVKGKLAAFERDREEKLAADPKVVKTWKTGAGGGYRKTSVITGKQASKKSLKDLP